VLLLKLFNVYIPYSFTQLEFLFIKLIKDVQVDYLSFCNMCFISASFCGIWSISHSSCCLHISA